MVGLPPESWVVPAEKAAATEVTNGLWRLRLPLPLQLVSQVNAYALRQPDGGITLIDSGGAGDPSAWQALLVALEQAGIELTDVRTLVVTHFHPDHAGLAARIVDETGCELVGHRDHDHFFGPTLRPGRVAAARRRRAAMEGVPRERLPDYGTVRKEFEGVLAPVLPDRTVAAGDRIGSALGEWAVIEVPGHAPSHIALHQPEHSLLICGDLVLKLGEPWFEYGYSADPVAETLDSLERIEQLRPAPLALIGHGRPIEDLGAAVDGWRNQVNDAVSAVRRAVEEIPGQGGYAIMTWLHGPDDGSYDGAWRLAQILASLRHLRLRKEVERSVADGRFGYWPTVRPARR